MPVVCSTCRAESPDGSSFCIACGRPLFSLPPVAGLPAPPANGEIPFAWSDALPVGSGPVRIAVTNLKTFVIPIGKPSLFPSPKLYREWETARAGAPHVRFTSAPWQTPAEPVRWTIDNDAIAEVRVSRSLGVAIAKDLCQVMMWVRSAGLHGDNPLVPFGEWVQFFWRVPGQPDEIRAFLVQLPFGSVVKPK